MDQAGVEEFLPGTGQYALRPEERRAASLAVYDKMKRSPGFWISATIVLVPAITLPFGWTDYSWWLTTMVVGTVLFTGWRCTKLGIVAFDQWLVANNKCVDCGYNLTGNISGVCPECGKAIEKRNQPHDP